MMGDFMSNISGVCPYPTCSIYGGCPNYCKYSSGDGMHCALDSYALQVPGLDLEIYISGAYDCTLEQSAKITVGLHGCPTEFCNIECCVSGDGYIHLFIDRIYEKFPKLASCPLPVLRETYSCILFGKRKIYNIWKIPYSAHYSYGSIHRVWKECGLL